MIGSKSSYDHKKNEKKMRNTESDKTQVNQKKSSGTVVKPSLFLKLRRIVKFDACKSIYSRALIMLMRECRALRQKLYGAHHWASPSASRWFHRHLPRIKAVVLRNPFPQQTALPLDLANMAPISRRSFLTGLVRGERYGR